MAFRFLRRRRRDGELPYPDVRPYASQVAARRRQPVPDRIGHIYVPLAVVEATDGVMRRFGREHRECYVWWGGYFNPHGDAQVVTALYPEIATDYGRIHLHRAELARLHTRLRELDQVLLAELHTHPPGAGGQNDVDAAHPAATYAGFISVVVPDFAHPHFYDLREAYVYEYLTGGGWHELNSQEIASRLVIEDTLVSVHL